MFLILDVAQPAEPLQWKEDVLVQKTGPNTIFIFPGTKGRIKASSNPAGKITIGNTIELMYSLKIINAGRARFVGVDGSQLTAKQIAAMKPVISKLEAGESFGFLIKDSAQPKLQIYISPSFMAEAKKVPQEELSGMKEKVARQGNLVLIIGPLGERQFTILKAILD